MITPLNPFNAQERAFIDGAGSNRRAARIISLVLHYYTQIGQYYTDRGDAWNLEDQAQCIAAFDRMLVMLGHTDNKIDDLVNSEYAREWEAFREIWTDETVQRLHAGWGSA